jgi:hypothetical protein
MGLRPTKVMRNGSHSATTVPASATLPFVISTEAYPDFLLRNTGHDHACDFLSLWRYTDHSIQIRIFPVRPPFIWLWCRQRRRG